MKKLLMVLLMGAGLLFAVQDSWAVGPFTECSPAVGSATSCNVEILINPDGTVSILTDATVQKVDTARNAPGDDLYVGVNNTSSMTLLSLTINGTNTFTFDGDGLCGGYTSPTGPFASPPGCPFGQTNGYFTQAQVVSNIGAGGNSGEVSFVTPQNSAGLVPGAATDFTLGGMPMTVTAVFQQQAPTPEPASLALVGTGVLGMGSLLRRRKKHARL